MGESTQLLQIYPIVRRLPLNGHFLSRDFEKIAAKRDRPFVYTNFLTSLDGRIALIESVNGKIRDWCLLLELSASADAIIMSDRYLNELAAGDAQAMPPFGDTPEELDEHRRCAGLSLRPAQVFVTRSSPCPGRPWTCYQTGKC